MRSLDPFEVERFTRLTADDLKRDRLLIEREVLHHLNNQLLSNLEHEPSQVWLQAAAINQLQARTSQLLGDHAMARAHREQADDCELHAFRLETGNNAQVMKHIKLLQKRK